MIEFMHRHASNESKKKKKININGAIIVEEMRQNDSEVSAYSFSKEMEKISEDDELIVYINSPGGVFFEGISIANQLKNFKNHVTININSLCASAATVVALAADDIRMDSNAMFMIHNVQTISIGDANTMRKTSEDLEKINGTLVDTYYDATKLGRSKIIKMMAEETWMNADEAKEYGFINTVISGGSYNPETNSKNSKTFVAQFKNTPKSQPKLYL